MGRYSYLRLFVLTVAVSVLVACKAPSTHSLPQPWSLTVEELNAESSQALLRCDLQNTVCSAFLPKERFNSNAIVKTKAGIQGTLSIFEHGTLWIDEQAEVVAQHAEQPTFELRRGRIAVQGLLGKPIILRWMGYEGSLDPMLPTRVLLKREDSDQAHITVLRGKLSIQRKGEHTIELRSGASARFFRSRPPENAQPEMWIGPKGFASTYEAIPLTQTQTPRGFGSMTARVPGQTEARQGVRLSSHIVRTQIRDGIARTEIEEIFKNDTTRVLEGRYVFPIPPNASISRLALWVGEQLIEGEVLEAKQAEVVFRSIVEDTVRPRDPALLEWANQTEVSLKVFPIPARGSRKVLLAYDQVLPMNGSEAFYTYPLSRGNAENPAVDHFEFNATIEENRAGIANVTTPGYSAQIHSNDHHTEIHFKALNFVPVGDFELRYERNLGKVLDVTQSIAERSTATRPSPSSTRETSIESHFLARLNTGIPTHLGVTTQTGLDRVFVVDKSYNQSTESVNSATRLVLGLLKEMDSNERFAILVCDSACHAFPAHGFESISEESLKTAKTWLNDRPPSGSTDLSAALLAGTQRFLTRDKRNINAQLIYLGDGAPTSGELAVERIERRIKEPINEQAIDIRLLGLGSFIDENTLSGLAHRLGAVYQRVHFNTNIDAEVAKLHLELRKPAIKHVKLITPIEMTNVCPKQLPNLVLGQDFLVMGKAIAATSDDVVLTGDINGTPYSQKFNITLASPPEVSNPYVSRLWATARIAELEEQSPNAATPELLELSYQYRVMSRHTAWLVLENNAMYREFGLGTAVGAVTSAASSDRTLEMATLGALSNAGPGNSELLQRAAGTKASKNETQLLAEPVSRVRGDLSLSGSGLSATSSVGFSAHVSGPKGRVDLGNVSVSGGNVSNAARVVAGMKTGFRNCFNRELATNPDAQGSIRVSLQLGPEGDVANVLVHPSESLRGAVTCVGRRAQQAQFDPPSGGSATIDVTAIFYIEEFHFMDSKATPGQPYVPFIAPKDSATHLPGDESWRNQGEDELERLRQTTIELPKSRKAREATIRALIRRGRYVEALSAAHHFVELDPDLPRALELLAYAAAAAANRDSAVAAIDSLVEVSPRNSRAHLRAAETFSSAGDEPRACAHWRSLDELNPNTDKYLTLAFRCRYRVFGERNTLLTEMRAITSPGPLLEALLAEVETGHVSPHVANLINTSKFKVSIRCEVKNCPTLLVVTPNGSVVSPWTADVNGSSERELSLTGLTSGIYRTLLIGGAPDAHGTVEINAFGKTRHFAFHRGNVDQTVASTKVSIVTPEIIEAARRDWWLNKSRL